MLIRIRRRQCARDGVCGHFFKQVLHRGVGQAEHHRRIIFAAAWIERDFKPDCDQFRVISSGVRSWMS